MKGPVVLLGPPGAGKSTAGAAAAALLGMPFVDLDQTLGDAAQVFGDEGEAGFRVREIQALEEALDGSDVVVAAGSGVVETAPARRLLEERALCVVLEVTPDIALSRIERGAHRPWLPSDPLAARVAWAERVTRRMPFWQELADACVMADDGVHDTATRLSHAIDHLRPIQPAAVRALFEERVEGALAAARGAGPSLVVAEAAVAAHLASVCPADVVIQGGESAKSLGKVEELARLLIARGARRDTTLVAVGGGALLDAVGLCAALLFRGVPWVAVPTTLLAQADAGLGGKTAVDLDTTKNVLGAFHPPVRTVICAAFLGTLDAHALHAGRVEMLKHELLAADAPLDGSALVHVDEVRRSLAVKTAVVGRDPRERGLRAALNLGHTLGHALEATFTLPHGHAVQHGLLAMLHLSVEHAGLAADVAATLEARVRALGPLAPLPDLGVRLGEMVARLAVDKKSDAQGLRWVLLRAPGLPVLARVPEASVRAVSRSLWG